MAGSLKTHINSGFPIEQCFETAPMMDTAPMNGDGECFFVIEHSFIDEWLIVVKGGVWVE